MKVAGVLLVSTGPTKPVEQLHQVVGLFAWPPGLHTAPCWVPHGLNEQIESQSRAVEGALRLQIWLARQGWASQMF